MFQKKLYLIVAAVFTLTFGASMWGQDRSGNQAAAQQAPAVPLAPGARAEFLEELAYYQQRFTRLAQAIPAEKYSWRPGEGVRSIGEVYAHIAAANYGTARALGLQAPAGLDFKAIQATAADKAKVTQVLKESFAHLRQAILAINDGDMDKAQKMFGRDTTVRGAFTMIVGHFGEHLGQSIAYARVNGITPPWTEEAQQQQQKAAGKPKP
jgi:uncharacterized damage-inducible protein DinB